MSTLREIASVARLLDPSPPETTAMRPVFGRDGRGHREGRDWGAHFREASSRTPEEATEALVQADAFRRDALGLGVLFGGVGVLVACALRDRRR
jgi:hypothetical protein